MLRLSLLTASTAFAKPPPALGLPDFITIPDAMARSGFGRSYIYERVADGSIEARKVGKAIRIVRASLDAFLHAAPRAFIRLNTRQQRRREEALAAAAAAAAATTTP